MIIFFMPIIFFLSILFTRLVHPLAAGIILLIQTSLISLSTGLVSSSFWFSYILFLVFLGGMLVLFIYVASLASNESFKTSFFYAGFISGVSLLPSTIFFFSDTLFSFQPVSMQHSSQFTKNTWNYSSDLTLLIYNFPVMKMTIVVILYLLFTLIVVVEVTSVFLGALRLSK
uniref:NADH-ubiquinone oxidoreductase chain 6 n=1 Tax=Panulirus homarus TaxID=150425 RepID=G3LTX9_PANHM|nr:NADH dehydrogenase subunit 6 [Panulirus homarus]AEO50356.1 NADH dehydrogenase subunit 6 [Panulirus homarus]